MPLAARNAPIRVCRKSLVGPAIFSLRLGISSARHEPPGPRSSQMPSFCDSRGYLLPGHALTRRGTRCLGTGAGAHRATGCATTPHRATPRPQGTLVIGARTRRRTRRPRCSGRWHSRVRLAGRRTGTDRWRRQGRWDRSSHRCPITAAAAAGAGNGAAAGGAQPARRVTRVTRSATLPTTPTTRVGLAAPPIAAGAAFAPRGAVTVGRTPRW